MDLDILNDAEMMNSKIRNKVYDRYPDDFMYDLIGIMIKIAEKYSNTAVANAMTHYTRDYNDTVMLNFETMLNGKKVEGTGLEKEIVKIVKNTYR